MVEKLEYYDILGVIIPGILLLGCIPICFPVASTVGSAVSFPEAFNVIALTALSIFLGQVVQSVASIIEPLIYWTWGGRPSDQALTKSLGGYLPADSIARIKAKLEQEVGGETDAHSLFLFAMQRSDAARVGRAARFNSLYAYHRGLLVTIVLVSGMWIGSLFWGRAESLSCGVKVASVLLVLLLVTLVWYRAKQRAFYYVREVLLTAERVLDEQRKAKE